MCSSDLHFKIEYPSRFIKNLIEDIADRDLNANEIPQVGHFALSTHPDGADKTAGRKSPRIHFFIGRNATIHILFYDPYHEVL